MSNESVLLIHCPDEKGLIYKISKVLFDFNLNIIVNAESVDHSTNSFFMRTALEGEANAQKITAALLAVLPQGSVVKWFEPRPKQLVLMATRETHCLGDLLLRCQTGELNAKAQAVISQYDEVRGLVEQFGIPFHIVPVVSDDRAQHEAAIAEVCDRYPFDYLVLAKYMRVLSAPFVDRYKNRVINIHHSFLPAFVGANPYKQAFDRGVKIIGATAHFVTEALDEGPIITQSVTPVNQAHGHQQMAKEGKEIERAVLARAVNLLTEDRVILHGNRTIIFE